jgi:hypothetical protein
LTEKPEDSVFEFVVTRHITEKDTEKEDSFRVVLKSQVSEGTLLSVKNIEITSSDDSIFTRFPQNERFKVVFKNPQTRLV